MQRVFRMFWGASGVIGIPLFMTDPISAQVPGLSPFDHTCTSCHMRDHRDLMATSETQLRDHGADSWLTMVPGITRNTTACLSCHSTEEQRSEYRASGRILGIPTAGGRYLGWDLDDDHPLGRSSGSPRLANRLRPPRRRPSDGPGTSPPTTRDRLVIPGVTVECSSCHDPHSDLDVGTAGGEKTLCSNCHDPAYYVFGGHRTPTCGDCHQMHGSLVGALLEADDPDALCSSCHKGANGFGAPVANTVLSGPPAHDDLQPGQCIDCHVVHRSPLGR